MYEEMIRRRIADFQAQRLNCAESVLTLVCEIYEIPGAFYPRIATAFGGGMCGSQGVCGAFTGGLMAIGLLCGREAGGDRMPAYEAGKALRAWFERTHGATDCRALTGADFTDPLSNEAFRAPGGRHETLCEPLVADVVRQIMKQFPQKNEP